MVVRILVAEADQPVASVLNDWLREEGDEVIGIVNTARQAQRLLDQYDEIDGALLDVSLQGKQSEEVAAALAARSIPFLLLSAYAPAGYVSQRLIAKPFKAGDLRQSLSQMLKIRQP